MTTGDWMHVRREHSRFQHSATAEDEGFRARNPRNEWLVHFDGHGFRIDADGGEFQWGLELAGKKRAWIRADRDRITYAWDDSLEEWFVNDDRGLEHGFTLQRGNNKIELKMRGGLRPAVDADGLGVTFANKAGIAQLRYSGLKAWDAAGRTLGAKITARGARLCIEIDDRGARYPIIIDPTVQRAYLKASNAAPRTFFGASVAISGDTMVVGAPSENSRARGVDGDQTDSSTQRAGAAYVFVRSGTTWRQQAYLKASNTKAGQGFGAAVAVFGDTIVVGAPGERSNATGVNGNQDDESLVSSGAVYVFVRNAGRWTQQAYLKASNNRRVSPITGFNFGSSLTMEGNTVVVGASLEDSPPSQGAAYVFVGNGGAWTEQAILKPSNPRQVTAFSSAKSVGISGNTVIMGHVGDNGSDGAAYVFVRSGTAWSEQAVLKVAGSRLLGISAAISGDTAVVGEQRDAAHVFLRTGATWTRQATLVGHNTEPGRDGFGNTAAIVGDMALIGAQAEDSDVCGVNPAGPSNNSASATGAAYLFLRRGTTWTQQDYIKSSNCGVGDLFGLAMALTGSGMVIGAPGEKSRGRGVDSTAPNFGATESGAAFVFEMVAPAPTAMLTASASTIDPGDTVTLTWTATNAARAAIEGIGVVESSGSARVSPQVTTAYKLTASGAGGSASASVTVTVRPKILSVINALDEGQEIYPGGAVNIRGVNLAAAENAAEDPLPTTLGGVTVLFDDLPAELWWVGPDQITLRVPAGVVAPAEVSITVRRTEGASVVTSLPFRSSVTAPPPEQ